MVAALGDGGGTHAALASSVGAGALVAALVLVAWAVAPTRVLVGVVLGVLLGVLVGVVLGVCVGPSVGVAVERLLGQISPCQSVSSSPSPSGYIMNVSPIHDSGWIMTLAELSRNR
jgi:hypothetical protein